MMLSLNTIDIPINIIYERPSRWTSFAESIVSGLGKVAMERDIFQFSYKNGKMSIKPFPQTTEFFGDIKDIATGLAYIIQSTKDTLNDDIIDEAFEFENGLIKKYNWPTNQNIEDFIIEYNKIYKAVEILK